MFGTPEVCKREDAGGIFPRRKVPSREREPKSEARSEAYRNATATSEIQMFGTPEGTRTPHLLLRRQLLYPDELLARIGASDGNRTHAHSLEGCCTSRYTTPALSRSASAIKFYHMVSRMSRIISCFCPNSSANFAEALQKVLANGFTARGWAVARGKRERESYGWKMECLHAGHHTREGHAASVRRQAAKGCDTAMTKSDFFDSLRRKAPEGDFIAKQPLRVALRRPTSGCGAQNF